MDHREAGRYWNESADTWTSLARAGYDVYRDHFNTPAFFEMLPDISGMSGLDIGCGEGYNTRLLAKRCASVSAIDISEVFIEHAIAEESKERLGIAYSIASAVQLPYEDGKFDFATGFMSFMDVPETDRVLAEAFRILKPGGFLQFSICHPCFDTAHRRNLRGPDGKTYAIEVGDYFRDHDGEVEEWLFCAAPAQVKAGLPNFKIPRFRRTLSEWFNLLVATGFLLEQVNEPTLSDEVVARVPFLQDTQVVSYFLHIRVRKPISV